MAKIIKSRPNFFGGTNHYDEHGKKIGESRPAIFGGTNHLPRATKSVIRGPVSCRMTCRSTMTHITTKSAHPELEYSEERWQILRLAFTNMQFNVLEYSI